MGSLSRESDGSGSGRVVFFFDIDNCLYPRSTKVHDLMAALIDEYFAKHLGLPEEEAIRLHHEYYKNYGLAIEGLVRHHQIDPLEYNAKVDDALPLEGIIKPNPELRKMLETIDTSKVKLWLLTNAYVTHARRVVKLLGIEDLFEGLTYCDYSEIPIVCKPHVNMYHKAMKEAGVEKMKDCFFVDDSYQNCVSSQNLGWTTAHLVEEGLKVPETKASKYQIRHLSELQTIYPQLFKTYTVKPGLDKNSRINYPSPNQTPVELCKCLLALLDGLLTLSFSDFEFLLELTDIALLVLFAVVETRENGDQQFDLLFLCNQIFSQFDLSSPEDIFRVRIHCRQGIRLISWGPLNYPKPPTEEHHDLLSYEAYAQRKGVNVDSTVYHGTRYEYTVASTLQSLGFDLRRVGGKSDKGIDLLGTWSLPSTPEHLPLRVLLQSKAYTKRSGEAKKVGRLGPQHVRELEGTYQNGPSGWRGSGVMGLLVGPCHASKGVRETLAQSRWPLGYVCCSLEGVVEQFLWNRKASEEGLEQLGVAPRLLDGDHHGNTAGLVLTWSGRPYIPVFPPTTSEESEVSQAS
ncbi:pyrimidine 5-nucleotidase [Xylariaceae sp. FL1019]|nr:pyrimidine 5-nucleotidase [Xylariaceae sp. FL1019]